MAKNKDKPSAKADTRSALASAPSTETPATIKIKLLQTYASPFGQGKAGDSVEVPYQHGVGVISSGAAEEYTSDSAAVSETAEATDSASPTADSPSPHASSGDVTNATEPNAADSSATLSPQAGDPSVGDSTTK